MSHRLWGVLAAVLPLVGCIAEDVSSACAIFRLSFQYTFNLPGVDEIDEQVRDIRVYVFEEATGLYLREIRISREEIEAGQALVTGLAPGRYTFVAWGSGDEELSRSFAGVHMIDAATHQSTEPVPGVTTLDDLYLLLHCEDDASDSRLPGSRIPFDAAFDDLFFANAEGVEVTRDRDQVIPFDFICNANTLNISVSGIDRIIRNEAEPVPAVQLFLVGENGRYSAENVIDRYAREVRYEATRNYLSAAADSMAASIKTLRFDVARHAPNAEPVLLYVRDAATGEDLVEPIDVLAAIRSIPASTRAARASGYLYPDQEAIDREREFPIDIKFNSDLTVSITIAGWEIQEIFPVIRPDLN